MKKNLRRISVLVTAQTANNLDRLAAMCGLRDQGRVIDKLVREKMLDLREPGYCGRHYICPACGAGLDDAPSESHPCPACGHGGG